MPAWIPFANWAYSAHWNSFGTVFVFCYSGQISQHTKLDSQLPALLCLCRPWISLGDSPSPASCTIPLFPGFPKHSRGVNCPQMDQFERGLFTSKSSSCSLYQLSVAFLAILQIKILPSKTQTWLFNTTQMDYLFKKGSKVKMHFSQSSKDRFNQCWTIEFLP